MRANILSVALIAILAASFPSIALAQKAGKCAGAGKAANCKGNPSCVQAALARCKSGKG